MEELPTMYGLPKEACSWIERMLKYTVDGGKMNRGLSLVTACKTFSKSKGHQEMDSKVCTSVAVPIVLMSLVCLCVCVCVLIRNVVR